MIYTRTMGLLQKELQSRYEVSSTIRHRGEKGRQREDGFAMFLRDHLPGKYGVATGEIIPFKGDTPSPQCDIVIYDCLSFPILGKSASVQQVPFEAVYSVIEVRSKINGSALVDASSKFRRIRTLPRCKQKQRRRRGYEKGPMFLLFGYELGTSEDACLEFIRDGQHEDIMLIALDHGFTIWLEMADGDVRSVFLRATDQKTAVYETLALSFAAYLDSLSSIDLGTPSYLSMMYSDK